MRKNIGTPSHPITDFDLPTDAEVKKFKKSSDKESRRYGGVCAPGVENHGTSRKDRGPPDGDDY